MRENLLPEAMTEEVEALWRTLVQGGQRCVCVTSAGHGEGASTLAAALARRAVLAGETALLAELSPRQPALAARLGQQLEPGVPLRIGADGFGAVSVPADAGGNWKEPSYLAWKLAEWRRDWSMVVLDAPPLLAAAQSNGPGGLAVASRAATTVLVVLAGRTRAEKVRQAQAKLLRAGGHLSGVVLNDRENPSLRAEMERELGRLARWAPRLVDKVRNRLRRSAVLGMRV